MTEAPNDEQPGFVAEEPEHCQPCLEATDAIRVTDDLAVLGEDGRLLVRRGGSTFAVFPSEAQHLVDALVEAAARLVDG